MRLIDIKKNAQAVFKNNKGLQELTATEDGQLFTTKNLAENHATKTGGTVRPKKLKIFVLKRDEILKMKFKEDKKKADPVNTDSENSNTDSEETQNTNSETENTNSDETEKTDSETDKK